jgi:hypothetical protein
MVFIYANQMGYGMTRRSASRGILYSAPPSTETNEDESQAPATTETKPSEPAAADD